jgi:dTDP-4-dehydrorhamnose reductase
LRAQEGRQGLSDEQIHTKLELWGGVECTVNRVGDQYFEQLHRSGHHHRISDLDLFANLGITALRQPVLWERVAPKGIAKADWSWSDCWLSRLRELNIRPIVGLLHHGSGPRDTNLLDIDFPGKFADFAAAVARRYPWVRDYTPVNEPLTTARFGALYGLWYPHARDERSFYTALINECRATVLAMRRIREINPAARLIHTEDLGKTHATPELQYQGDFENARRWLGIDLLCGRVNKAHPCWAHILGSGVDQGSIEFFNETPSPPDVLGFNYYLSSERYLDQDTQRYPAHLRGGNGHDAYVDIEAARLRWEGISGPGTLLREAWERYQIPLAITECHNGCTREEQLRWFLEVWRSCEALKGDGIDVQAVTAWSLLGAYDWNSLVTRKADIYESGVFDIRAAQPRPTAIASLAKALAAGDDISHPLLDGPGWWHRQERFLHGIAIADSGRRIKTRGPQPLAAPDRQVRPILITGGTGTLGRAFARACIIRGIPYRLTLRSEMDITDPTSVSAECEALTPWAIINTAGYVRVDDAEDDAEHCMRENAMGALVLASECVRRGMRYVTFSSDLVFDGSKDSPYTESDATNPLNVYGRSKLVAEFGVLHRLPGAIVVRTSAFFGPWDQHNFVTIALRELASGRRFLAPADTIISPTYVPDLVDCTLDLMIDAESGLWHLANSGEVSWYELAKRVAEMAGVSTESLVPCATADLRLAAERPLYSALASERAWMMPTLESALSRYMAERETVSAIESEAA